METETRLPLEDIREDFLAAREKLLLIQAPPGSGKTLRVPQWIFEEGKSFLLVEPRRVAAKGAFLWHSKRMTNLGFCVRFEHHLPQGCHSAVVTPGILLNWLEEGLPFEVDFIILDEVHERSLEMDLLQALFFQKCPARLILMSATLDQTLYRSFSNLRVLQVESRQYPLEVEYAGASLFPSLQGMNESILKALKITPFHAALVFLPGKGEIQSARQTLLPHFKNVHAVHGGMRLEEQHEALRSEKSRVLLATNLLESAVTANGVNLVIDSGLRRGLRFFQGKEVLLLEAISEDAAEQRAGRAGRQGPGKVIRLWQKAANLEKMSFPEVLIRDLSPVVLRLNRLKRKAEDLKWLTDLPEESLKRARTRLGLCEVHTPEGRKVRRLPVEPEWFSVLCARGRLNPRQQFWLAQILTFNHADLRQFRWEKLLLEEKEGFPRPDLLLFSAENRQKKLGDESVWFEEILKDFCRELEIEVQNEISVPERDEALLFLMHHFPGGVFHARGRGRWHSDSGEDVFLSEQETSHKVAAVFVASRFVIQKRMGKETVQGNYALFLPWGMRDRLPVTRKESGPLDERGQREVRSYCGPHLQNVIRENVIGEELARLLWESDFLWPKSEFLLWRTYQELGIALGLLEGEVQARERFLDLGLETLEDLELIRPEELFSSRFFWELPRLIKDYPLELREPGGLYQVQYLPEEKEVRLIQKGKRQKPSRNLIQRLPKWKIVWEALGRAEVLQEGRL